MFFVGLTIYIMTLLFVGVILPLLGVARETCNIGIVVLLIYGYIADLRARHGRMVLRHIPIVPNWPLVGPLPYITIKLAHRSMEWWARKLGPLFRMPTAGGVFLIASSYEAIRDVCIAKGKDCAGRPTPFLTRYMLKGTGILFQHTPDNTWKSLRMESHKHLKQFGEGMTRLEEIITKVAEEMFQPFKSAAIAGEPCDPKEPIFDAALINIAFLITGIRHKAGEEIVEEMRTYEKNVLTFIGAANDLNFVEYDDSPWIRHLNLSTWQTIEGVKKLQDSIWERVEKMNKAQPELKSLYNVLIKNVETDGNNGRKESQAKFSEDDVKMTVLSLLLAGVTTTSTTFYAVVNIMAHRPHIQQRIFEEVKKIDKLSDPITLLDRQDMPYCRAVLFEVLRYASVVPMGVPHRTVADVEIAGILVPKDTPLSTNLWAMHHDRDFWVDPYSFIPERFLTDGGDLVTADHPNRKHLMPFGAGPRVCLGESLALARLFLWISTFVQRFRVEPAEGNTWEKSDGRNYEFDGVVRVCPYKVNFFQRETYQD